MKTCAECGHYDSQDPNVGPGEGVCYGAPPTFAVPIPMVPMAILNPNGPPQPIRIEFRHVYVKGTKRACGAFQPLKPTVH